EKVMRTKTCQPRCNRSTSRRRPFAGGASLSSGCSSSTSVLKLSGVRLSTSVCRLYAPSQHPARARRGAPGPSIFLCSAEPLPALGFLESIADAIQRFDHIEVVVGPLELLAQSLDVAVDGAVIDVDLIVIGRVHQRVAALDHAGPARERLQDQELGDGQC